MSKTSASGPLRIKDQVQFSSILAKHKLVVAFFTRDGCAPCRAIAPDYEGIVSSVNSSYTQIGSPKPPQATKSSFVYPVIIHASEAPLLPSQYSITGFPTFAFFLDGKRDESSTVLGADRTRLQRTLEHLVGSSYPPHRHANVTTRGIGGKPALFGVGQDLAKVLAKLEEVLGSKPPIESEMWQTIESVAVKLGRKDEIASKGPIPDGERVVKAFRALYHRLITADVDSVFPLLDLLRLCVLNDVFRSAFVDEENDGGNFIMEVVLRCVEVGEGEKAMGKAGRVMVVRMVANLFSDPSSAFLALSLRPPTHHQNTPRTLITALLVESLLSPDTIVRQTASSLAYNISLAVQSSYEGSGVDILAGGSIWPASNSPAYHSPGFISEDDESWLVEVVSAVARAAEEERDGEVLVRLVAALVGLARFATEMVTGVIQAVDVVEKVKERVTGGLEGKDKDAGKK
ncbi:hypothetical protein HDU93_004434, partial [Gonapodya sp. JEL0774]